MKLNFVNWIRVPVLMMCLAGFFLAAAPVVQAADTNTATTIRVDPSQEVTSVTTLLEQRKYLLTFGLDRIEALQPPLFGIHRWQYLASLIYIFLAFFVSKFLDYFIGSQLKRWATKTQMTLDDLLISLIHGPVKIISMVILLHVGLQVFEWPAWVEQWLSRGLKIVVAASLTYMAVKLVDLLMGYWRQRAMVRDDRAFNELLVPIVSKSLKVFVVIVAVLMTSQNLGMNITSLLAGVSVGGLAIGLAAQDTLGNLFGAVSVFVDKPFQIGDRVKLADVDGVVESIGLRSTRIRNLDGHLITVPNKTMGNSTIINITRRPNIKTEMNIGVTYDTSVAKMREAVKILEEVFRKHPMTADLIISFNKFADSSLNILVVHWWGSTDHKAYLAGMQEMNLDIKARFEQAGINFAFPSRTIYVKQDSRWQIDEPRKDAPQIARS
jgi:MscS family membrane protein